MQYALINTPLRRRLAYGESLILDYPKGTTQGTYFSGIYHILTVGERCYRAPSDFIIEFTPEHVRFIWMHARTLPEGSILHLQLERSAAGFYRDHRHNVTILHMVSAHLFMIDLRAPLNKNLSWYRQPLSVPCKSILTLDQKAPDLPRNVTIHSTGNDTHLTFTVTGENCYGAEMAENIQGANQGVAFGRKAFAAITSIAASESSDGDVAIGYGNRLGLPVYLPAAGYVMRALANGEEISGGRFVPGDAGYPSATGGDRRGTYTPPRSLPLDGRHALHILLSLPNPGNTGAAEYTDTLAGNVAQKILHPA